VSVVLVVEDEPLVRLSICEELASDGYEVLSAANADQAIEVLESRNDINTVFTDVEMPGPALSRTVARVPVFRSAPAAAYGGGRGLFRPL
jgi:CheY-like chemotaxis protein